MRDYYAGDPYRTVARYRSTCPTCGKPINKGDEITIWPKSRKGQKAHHWRCSEDDYRRFEAAAYDEYVMTRGY